MKTYFSLILMLAFSDIFSQKEDFFWPMGYDGNIQTGYQNFSFNFNENNLFINYNIDLGIDIYDTQTIVSDKEGKLILYSNGCKIMNSDYKLIENGDSINTLAIVEFCKNIGGYRVGDGAVCLPWPGENNVYGVIQVGVNYIYVPQFAGWTARLSYSKIDMNKNNGEGLVIEKDEEILWDSLSGGQLEAVRHANGRDWWLIQSRLLTNKYYIFLFDSSGINLKNALKIGDINLMKQDFLQASFSHSGNQYIKIVNDTVAWVFDFDRCSGLLSNFHKIENIPALPAGFLPSLGLAFSPDDKFLYISNGFNLFQYDLSAGDISDSRILIETWVDLPTTSLDYFGRMAVAADRKIYLNTFGGAEFLHIIHDPNKKGLECQFQRNAIVLDSFRFNRGLPNFPNWRLGPVDGSACDTLGIDNRPWAHWRWETDTIDYLKVFFRDLSGFEPEIWHWDFGDGTTSDEPNPLHTYAAAGMYHVCEIVSNAFAADTFCREVTVSTVSIPEPWAADEMRAFPNPVTHDWKIQLAHPLEAPARLNIYTVSGQLSFTQSIEKGTVSKRFSLENLPAGLYFYQINQKGINLKTGRLVKIE
jgi:hypothetical protein